MKNLLIFCVLSSVWYYCFSILANNKVNNFITFSFEAPFFLAFFSHTLTSSLSLAPLMIPLSKGANKELRYWVARIILQRGQGCQMCVLPFTCNLWHCTWISFEIHSKHVHCSTTSFSTSVRSFFNCSKWRVYFLKNIKVSHCLHFCSHPVCQSQIERARVCLR